MPQAPQPPPQQGPFLALHIQVTLRYNILPGRRWSYRVETSKLLTQVIVGSFKTAISTCRSCQQPTAAHRRDKYEKPTTVPRFNSARCFEGSFSFFPGCWASYLPSTTNMCACTIQNSMRLTFRWWCIQFQASQ